MNELLRHTHSHTHLLQADNNEDAVVMMTVNVAHFQEASQTTACHA